MLCLSSPSLVLLWSLCLSPSALLAAHCCGVSGALSPSPQQRTTQTRRMNHFLWNFFQTTKANRKVRKKNKVWENNYFINSFTMPTICKLMIRLMMGKTSVLYTDLNVALKVPKRCKFCIVCTTFLCKQGYNLLYKPEIIKMSVLVDMATCVYSHDLINQLGVPDLTLTPFLPLCLGIL